MELLVGLIVCGCAGAGVFYYLKAREEQVKCRKELTNHAEWIKVLDQRLKKVEKVETL